MILDLRDQEQQFWFYYGRFEKDLIEAVKRHLPPGAFYDVGASIGVYSCTFGRLCRATGGYVRAIEPSPLNIARLRQQLPCNGLDESVVRIDEVALGDRECRDTLKTGGGIPGNAILAQGDFDVFVTTLDALWRHHGCEPIGFIKLDTEGWDARIIMGGQKAIRTCLPNLLAEFNRHRMQVYGISLEPCWGFLVDELGYEPHRVAGRGRLIRIAAPGDFENILFVHPASCDMP